GMRRRRDVGGPEASFVPYVRISPRVLVALTRNRSVDLHELLRALKFAVVLRLIPELEPDGGGVHVEPVVRGTSRCEVDLAGGPLGRTEASPLRSPLVREVRVRGRPHAVLIEVSLGLDSGDVARRSGLEDRVRNDSLVRAQSPIVHVTPGGGVDEP